MKYPTVSSNPSVQGFYEQVRRNLNAGHKRDGTPPNDVHDHRFAEMLAMRRVPGVSSETAFLSGRGTLDKQFDGDDLALNECVANARKHGYNPSPHDVYLPSLARFIGDPEAFCRAGDGKSHVRKVCEERGWSCDGAVKVKGRETERDFIKEPEVPLAADIVQQEVQKLRKDPKNAKKKNKELAEQVIDKHALKL